MAVLGSQSIVIKCAGAIYIPISLFEPRALVLLDQQLGNEQPWKVLFRS